ncbi:5555_t:CDS:1 [Paraglomus brasilianum]|uniref:5555_t:CDS:1 n=1 Tax=Paraglomus brasilianum TaxID=144538 RepID=A0A9N9C494_9GLOM|nr:5555_t:CDS:1 [Paraglomus brasilianum]
MSTSPAKNITTSCIVCNASTTKRCARCNKVYYCNAEHQKLDWKSHKMVCTPKKTSEKDNNAMIIHGQRQTEEESFADLDILANLMKLVDPEGPFSNASSTTSYATEYKNYYPTDSSGYNTLSISQKLGVRLAVHEKFLDKGDGSISMSDPVNIQKRWGLASFELTRFLSSHNLRKGSVYRDRVKKKCKGIDRVVQNFANEAKLNIIYAQGRNNFAIGFVDLSILLGATITSISVGSNKHKPQPKTNVRENNVEEGQITRLIGFDASEYAVAKTKVVVAMIANNAPTLSIVQVWYSTVWTKTTYDHFLQAVDAVMQLREANRRTDPAEKIPNPEPQDRVFKIVRYWSSVRKRDSRLRVTTAHENWMKHCPPTSSPYMAVENLSEERDRVELARHIMTGEFPLLSGFDNNAAKKGLSKTADNKKKKMTDHMKRFAFNDNELLGSVTMFACLDGYEPHKDTEMALRGIPMVHVLAKYDCNTTSLLDAVYSYLEGQINRVKQWLGCESDVNGNNDGGDNSTSAVKTPKIILKIFLYKADLIEADCDWLSSYVKKELKPCTVLWSNHVCDYRSKDDFHRIARSLSGPQTRHFMYTMNWMRDIMGAMILDVKDGNERVKILENAKELIKSIGPIIDKSGYFIYQNRMDHPYNVGGYLLAHETKDYWVTYFFENEKTNNVLDFISPFICTAQSSLTLHLIWSYNKNFQPTTTGLYLPNFYKKSDL